MVYEGDGTVIRSTTRRMQAEPAERRPVTMHAES